MSCTRIENMGIAYTSKIGKGYTFLGGNESYLVSQYHDTTWKYIMIGQTFQEVMNIYYVQAQSDKRNKTRKRQRLNSNRMSHCTPKHHMSNSTDNEVESLISQLTKYMVRHSYTELDKVEVLSNKSTLVTSINNHARHQHIWKESCFQSLFLLSTSKLSYQS